MTHTYPRIFVFLLFLLAGCSAEPAASSQADAVYRGPGTLPISADANGLWWDDGEQTLYIADDNGNRILKWTDADGTSLVSDLPAPTSDSPGLGQLVITSNRTIVVTRFGYGTAGDIVFIPEGSDPEVVPDLDPERRRIGLTVAGTGQLFDSWFVRVATGARVGAVGELSLEGTEVVVIDGLQKPVGVLAVGDDLFVSDQDLGQVLKAPIVDPASYAVHAVLESPDLLTTGPDGSLFSGSLDGNVYRISASGAASVFQAGFQQTRGVAYDPTHRRLFVAEHDADESDGIDHLLHVFPVD